MTEFKTFLSFQDYGRKVLSESLSEICGIPISGKPDSRPKYKCPNPKVFITPVPIVTDDSNWPLTTITKVSV